MFKQEAINLGGKVLLDTEKLSASSSNFNKIESNVDKNW